MRILIATAALAATLLGTGATLARPRQSNLLDAMLACRAETDAAKRLACFDAAAGKIALADQRSEVVVVDKETARAARKKAYGLSEPHFPGLAKDQDEKVTELLATVGSASRAAAGGWVITLDDGSVWRQTDDRALLRDPQPGNPVLIRDAAVGTYWLKIGKEFAFKARRVR